MKSTMNELLSDIPYNLVPPQELGGITPITCYSELYDGSALFDSTNALRKFKIPAIPQDLITGYERWVDKLSRSPPKPKALDWIILSCLESNKLVKELLQATVITTRGVLSRLSLEEESEMSLSFTNGRLFIEKYDGIAGSRRTDKLMYIGHALKEACTKGGSRDGEWTTVISRNIGEIRVLFGSQVDCIKGNTDDHLDSSHFLQMKTMRSDHPPPGGHVPPAHSWNRYSKWYMQAHLLGITHFFVGYRTRQDLYFTQKVPVKKLIPTRGSGHHFDPSLAVGRIHRVLNALLKFSVSQEVENGEQKVWRATVTRGGALTITELTLDEKEAAGRVGLVEKNMADMIHKHDLKNAAVDSEEEVSNLLSELVL